MSFDSTNLVTPDIMLGHCPVGPLSLRHTDGSYGYKYYVEGKYGAMTGLLLVIHWANGAGFKGILLGYVNSV